MTLTPLGEAREWAKAQIGAIDGVIVYDFQPENPTMPCLVVGPGGPWVAKGGTLSKRAVGLMLTILVAPTGGNEGALERTEMILWHVLGVLPGAGPVEAPIATMIGQQEAYRTNIPLAVLVDEGDPA